MAGITMEERSTYDLHGFLIENERNRCSGCLNSTDVVSDEVVLEVTRGELWTKLLCAKKKKDENKNIFDYQKSTKALEVELKSLGWEYGQPLSSLVNCVEAKMAEYKDEVLPESISTMRQILMDVDRTFPNHRMFLANDFNKFYLFRILLLYTWYNSITGYCQGMAYVAALLKMYIDCEEDVFWCFSYLLDNQCLFFYEKDLKRIKVLAQVVRTVLNERLPEIGSQLDSLGVHPLMYTTQWFMGFFTGLNCWDTVLYIAELIFKEGSHHLLNAAITILESCKEQVHQMSKLEEVLPFLQNIPSDLIHRECIENILSHSQQFQNVDEMNNYLVEAEKQVDEDNKMDQIHRSISHKRSRNEEEETDHHPLFKSTKKSRVDTSESSSISTESTRLRKIPTTPWSKPFLKQVIKTSTIKKSALDSVKKGHAELCYTKDTGLIYTSPNTMEMKDLTIEAQSPFQPNNGKENNNSQSVAMKLAFESVCETPTLKNKTRTSNFPRRSQRIINNGKKD